MKILIGHERSTGKPVFLPVTALDRHMHMIGYTGAGKTTAIITLLQALLANPLHKKCVIIIDRLGGFSLDLLRWFSSTFCQPSLRKRLIYIEGAREETTVPMNPLLFGTPGEGYYRTARAAEIVLRGWTAQDLGMMPRLHRWLFNSMWAMAQLKLTIGDSSHLLFPYSQLHPKLLACLPEELRYEWQQIIDAKGNQAEIQLESCRNRLKPFFDSPVLRAMFSSQINRFDVRRWMQEKRIVVINLAPMGRLPETSADTIGGLVVNEVFSVARSLPLEQRTETLLVLDEFQRFIVGTDLEFALAESRQLKTNLLLSHQSFSQLKSENVDLTSLIFQAQTRLMFRVAGEDADLLSNELASFNFDPMKVKDEIWHRCQRISGHRIIELQSESTTNQWAENWNKTFGHGQSRSEGESHPEFSIEKTLSKGNQRNEQESQGSGASSSHGATQGKHQTLMPLYEQYVELATRSFVSFEEQRANWGRRVRRLKTGQGVLQIVNDDNIYEIDIKRSAPGHLIFNWETVLKQMPSVTETYHRLLEENFQQECFVTPAQVQLETKQRLEQVLRPVTWIRLPADQEKNGSILEGDSPPLI